ncbi:hypothetical protein ACNQVK_24565 [Mycobacterium sp. 134]|uniref:hypothetical protein n=1 Tax=Mycobacterium sp. 134 TaxID=3400425 RepID=UPI003AAD60E4
MLRPAALQRQVFVELGEHILNYGHRATVAELRPRCTRRAEPLPSRDHHGFIS